MLATGIIGWLNVSEATVTGMLRLPFGECRNTCSSPPLSSLLSFLAASTSIGTSGRTARRSRVSNERSYATTLPSGGGGNGWLSLSPVLGAFNEVSGAELDRSKGQLCHVPLTAKFFSSSAEL